ncbi:MAG: hypothetical protein IPO08_21555 [Xanthomonadales bacterium]|nr:hypothetical protein [Xanthomonadales bacterium]
MSLRGGASVVVIVLLSAPAAAQTTTTRTDRLVASTSVVIGGTSFTTSAATIGTSLGVTGATTLNGNVTLGDASGDALNFSGRVNTSILWTTDNLVDLGASGANRPRDLFLGRNAAIGGTLGVTGNTTLTGDVAINGNDLTSTGVLTVRPTGNLTLDPTGDVIFGADGLDVLPAAAYTYNLGSLTNKYLTLHAAELWVETLVAQDTIATIGGRILVGPTTMLSDSLLAAATDMKVKHNNLANGDRVYLEANGAVEFIAVTSAASGGAGNYIYSITRNLDGSGANDWAAGDAVFNTGQTGSGWIDLYSVRGVKVGTEEGPTICGNERQSSTYNDWESRWCVGNLNGVYGYSADTYGAAFGDPSANNLVLDATNGVRFRNGTTVLGQLSSTTWTLGSTSTEHLNLTSTALEFKNGATVLGSLDGSTLTLGQPLTANNTGQVLIDSDSIDFRWRNNAGSTSVVFQVKDNGGVANVYAAGFLIDAGTINGDSDGSRTYASRGTGVGLTIQAGSSGTGTLTLDAFNVVPDLDNSIDLGSSSAAWSEIFVDIGATVQDVNPIGLGSNGQFFEKTDGLSGTVTCTAGSSVVITVESGIVISVTGTGCS